MKLASLSRKGPALGISLKEHDPRHLRPPPLSSEAYFQVLLLVE